MKLFATLVVLLLAGLAAADLDDRITEAEIGKTVKDTVFFEDYFHITITKDNHTEGYEGWSHYKTHITCKNGTSEGDLLFPYEEVEYILAVRSVGNVLEKIAEGSLVYVPGHCNLEVEGKHFISKQTKNITLVHLFKPQHSRVPAKEYEVVSLLPPKEIGPTGMALETLEKFMGRPMAVVASGFGITLFLVGVMLNLMHPKKLYSYILFMLGITLTVSGLIMGVA